MTTKCYVCGQEASVAIREQAMFMTNETMKFYCRECYERGPRRAPPVAPPARPQGRTDEKKELGGPIPEGVIIICPNCGAKNSRTDRQCGACDTDLEEAKKLIVENTRKR